MPSSRGVASAKERRFKNAHLLMNGDFKSPSLVHVIPAPKITPGAFKSSQSQGKSMGRAEAAEARPSDLGTQATQSVSQCRAVNDSRFQTPRDDNGEPIRVRKP